MASNRFIYYILAAFIAGNLLLIFIQYNSSKNINDLIAGNEKVLNEFKLENELRDLRKNIISVETSISRAVDSRNTFHIINLQQEIAAAEINLGRLQKIDDNDSSVIYIDLLDELVHKKIQFNNRVLQTFYHTGKMAADSLIYNGRQNELTDSVTLVTHKIENSRRNLLTSITAFVDKSGQNARRWGTLLFIMVAASGAALFWFIINRVKRQNQLIVQLDASEKQVKEAAKVKENFMANMSHEIRTPMNAIVGFTSLLQKKNLDADSVAYVQSIQKSGENLLTIINDILDFSKFEAGMMRIEPVPFSLREMLHSIETMFHQKAFEKKLSLIVTVNDTVPDLLEGDASRLTQILVNLIGNAVKFTDHGSIRVYADDSGVTGKTIQLLFSVTDTGIGIAKNELPVIFERFRQAEASITRKYGGTGLGLSIVKDLVLLQNGTISVDSEPGKGTAFRFIIPYKIIDSIPVTADTAEINDTIPIAFHNASILVVEDNEINQTLMKHLLAGWQLSFTIAGSGKEALTYLQQKTFDLVLMDIQMPEIDGYTAAQQIRQNLHLDTPIVAMTAHALAGEREKCISYGMNDYISKPI
ncbi:MAG TPA: ATP-binding protein, partial [Chitinophagaceae bacterium]|nr:ATP-binding protein [Chitinophagaceae bacterium]